MFARISVPFQLLLGLVALYIVYRMGTMIPARQTVSIKTIVTDPEVQYVHKVLAKQQQVDEDLQRKAVMPSAQKSLTLGNREDTEWLKSIMDKERAIIHKTLADYPFTNGNSEANLIYEQGGNPIKAMIATTWRSGSTFIGDVLLSHPATFYHYEPLLHFKIVQARHGELAEEGIRVIKQLMKCNYENLDSYFEYGRSHHELFSHNTRYYKYCKGPKGSKMCWRPKVAENMCKLFPFQSIKTVRMRANLTREFLKDDSLNVKVILLVRDPRGTLQSRLHRVWCPKQDDCDKPERLCSDLVSDYKAAQKLLKEYPDRFLVYRYEDFASEPSVHAPRVLSYFGFAMHPQVRAFLASHTRNNVGGVSSTFRDSRTAPYHWKHDLPFKKIQEIQKECSEALRLWGYYSYASEEELDKIHPVMNYTMSKKVP